MLVSIPDLLGPGLLAECRNALARAEWGDGAATAGFQSARAKRNLQLPEHGPTARALGDLILRRLERDATFLGAALPRHVYPPLFNRYEAGMEFGPHVDNAVRQIPGSAHRLRTDVSATLFLTDPDEYDGGELVIADTYGPHAVKLPAGSMVLYPSTSLHHVTPVTRGARVCAFFWIQSMIRDDTARALLFEMDGAIQDLASTSPDAPAVLTLTGCYHNLIRRWAEI